MAPIFLSYDAPFEWMFIDDYFQRFLGRNPFGHAALDIKTFFASLSGLTGMPSRPVTSERYLNNRGLRTTPCAMRSTRRRFP